MQDGNPFGFKDHRPFTGFSDELVYGLAQDGRTVHVSDVPSGLRCDCRCPACDRPLVAKKGSKQLHHFAHYSKTVSCSYAAETNAHFWAKEVLERERRLTIPPIIAEHHGQTEIVSPAKVYTFAHAKLEKRLGSIVPDVVLVTASGTQLIVEVHVTHACDDAKIAKLQNDGLSAVEIDLRRFRTSADQVAVENALLSTAPRSWLSNAKQAKFNDRLRDRLAADAARKLKEAEERTLRIAEAEARRVRREQEETTRETQKLIRAFRTYKGDVSQIPDAVVAFAETFDDLPLSQPRTVGFAVHPLVWQIELAREFLTLPNALDYQWSDKISVQLGLRAINRHLIPAFRGRITPAVRERLRQEWPHHRVPSEAVALFLDDLVNAGFLRSEKEGEYSVTDEYADRLSERERQRREFERRSEDLRSRVSAVLMRLPASERSEFDLDRWFGVPLMEQGGDPTTLCRLGGEGYRGLDRALKRVELLSEGGPITGELLGLPLEGEIARAQERERDKLLRAAAQRRSSLAEAAQRELSEEANAWLSGPSEENHELSRIDQAGLDDLSYQRARGVLAAAAAARQVAIQAEKEALLRRSELKEAAAKVYDRDRADLFVRAFDPRLGKSPIDHCVDYRTLQECIALLPPAKRSSRR